MTRSHPSTPTGAPAPSPSRFSFVASAPRSAAGAGQPAPLPALLSTTTRAAGDSVDPLLAALVVEQRYTLAGARRGAVDGEATTLSCAEPQLLALEAEDGSTLLIRSDALAEAVAQLQPDALVDGVVDLTRFTGAAPQARGVGAIAWRTLSVLRLADDAVASEAAELARRWAGEQVVTLAADQAGSFASLLGAKALMWTIEARLAGRPGLYRWSEPLLVAGDLCAPCAAGQAVDARLADAAQGQPMLVLIHGTGSYTVGAFADLRNDERSWQALTRAYPGGIFGFEHRTFSQSPAENTLELLQALPDGAQVALLSHSRGGLVGDLLCLGEVDDAVIAAYHFDSQGASDAAGLEERESEAERARLRAIRDQLHTRRIVFTRYLRVAAPARGTRLLSYHLDAALSDFLNVLQWGGGALFAASSAALGGPVAGIALEHGASSCLAVVKRLVLEIAARRIDARLVPGIAAMLTESPLAALLANPATGRQPALAMAVVAGDSKFDGGVAQTLGAPCRRIANLFCDWRLFDGQDNDFVVDTDSMYAGLAFRPGARYLFDQDTSVSHFRYFRNALTRDALCAWLTDEQPERLPQFSPLGDGDKTPWSERDAREAKRGTGGTDGSEARHARPVAIIVPGIMGTHLMYKGKKAHAGKRIWFASAPLALGEIERIADVHASNIATDDLFELIYGELADHLAATHTVLRCPYDWRLSPEAGADALRQKIDEAAREHPGQAINLVAHSLGGLVARCLIARHPQSWRRVVDSGGRLLMLGTPNNGAHIIVHTLLGKASAVRLLEKLDLVHDLQAIVDIVGGFPGVLALLPRPGFADSGSTHAGCIASADYYRAATWQALKQANHDRWYGDAVGALPSEPLLGASAAWWESLGAGNEIADAKRVIYVYGQGERTPCGVALGTDGRSQLLYTREGDGWVSWASGHLDNVDDDTQSWLMPVEHGDLTCSPQHFAAIVNLLESGRTDRLSRLPCRRGEAAPAFVLDSAPPIQASEDELAHALVGGSTRRRRTTRSGATLHVTVRGGDLRAIDIPVLCGHYLGDAISGAEAVLDTQLAGALAERERIGVYAGELGTSAIVLRAPTSGAAVARGAVVVGLGRFDGQLGARQLTETVRAGVVRFLLQLRDAFALGAGTPVELCSLLIGWNSTASISVAESVAAICRGVLEANHQFSTAAGQRSTAATVAKLTFVELYRNAAIAAAHAVAALPATLAAELKRLGARIDAAPALESGAGLVDPLGIDDDVGHWSRLLVSDADDDQASATADTARAYPERLKYVLLSPRARAETVVGQHQPGVIEAIVSTQRDHDSYNERLGRTLFRLLVPVDFQAAAREQARLLLVLDGYSARLPWELLQADDEPLVLTMPMVRQLATQRYRPALRTAGSNSACLIAAPSTAGFNRRFGGTRSELANLAQAERETQAIGEALRRAGWNDSDIVVSPPEREAIDVLATLYARPYRVLAIAAHGVFEAPANDGRRYTGVVLSDGLLLTAVEIERMEVVPELVFINCCHLGRVNDATRPQPAQPGHHADYDQLAYSLARQLIELGVRCIVAAAWAVDDSAACTFASTLFDRLAAGERFGAAVFAARRATFDRHPGSNTWGAYQAYGDPGYRLHTDAAASARQPTADYVALDELLAAIVSRRAEIAAGVARVENPAPAEFARQRQWVERQLARCPPRWAEDPRLLQEVAALYAGCGEAGFGAARDAYLRALATDDPDGRVTLTAIEDLAALEIAHVEALVVRFDDATPSQREAAQQVIGDTLARLDALITARAGGSGDNGRLARNAALRERALACRHGLVPGKHRKAAS